MAIEDKTQYKCKACLSIYDAVNAADKEADTEKNAETVRCPLCMGEMEYSGGMYVPASVIYNTCMPSLFMR